MKRQIYFNTIVSNYFNVDFDNKDVQFFEKATTILKCPIVSWDMDVKKTLEGFGDSLIPLVGVGSGYWEIQSDRIQHKPNSEAWNNPPEEKRSPRKSFRDFMKGGSDLILFI